MSEMNNRLAEALYIADCFRGVETGGAAIDVPAHQRPAWDPVHYGNLARVAIQAMREPTQAMVIAAEREHGFVEGFAAEAGWRTMIDAALSGPPSPPKRWRHRNGSTYTMVGPALAQTTKGICDYDAVVVYRAEEDGLLWVRPVEEFTDGRFTEI